MLGVGGNWLYINVIKEDAREALSFDDVTTTTAPSNGEPTDDTSTTEPESAGNPSGAVDGAWTIRTGTQVGYRVKEILFGQDTEGVGPTIEVTGGDDHRRHQGGRHRFFG